jgi:arginine decarboxylase
MTRKNHREFFHDAEAMRDELLSQFDLGYLSLRDRALAERLMRRIGRDAIEFSQGDRFVPEEFERVRKQLVTKYIANFSVFQSLPDAWALDQLFPLLPIHRLNERPTVPSTLCDVTCDSFGEIDRFVDRREVRESLDLHELRPGEPYYIAVCLIGAYQDVLGDYHNLFGRVDEVEVRLTPGGAARVMSDRSGDEAHEVLALFGHEAKEMVERVRGFAMAQKKKRRLSAAQVKCIVDEYSEALAGYTYLSF